MDELLGDIRSGFPERRLGRRDPDERLKRHSDPAMLEKCGDLDDRLGTFKSRRARFLDGRDVPGIPQNTGTADGEMKDRRSFGSVEDSLERVSFRRSGRRKRVGLELNGDAQSRERSGSSPPPQAILPTVESQEPEIDSKLRLRSKINDWMLQNEKEQKRERDLQLKLLQERKKRLSNGQLMNGDVPSVENNILEEVEESDLKQVAFKQKCNSELLKNNSLLDDNDNFKITKSASSRRSESFTQKIIGLIDATSNGSKPFAKTRLYSSTRESGAVREEPENKSKDDSQVYTEYGRQASSSEDQNATQDASKKPESNFDRFAPTRKTQRRLKLREMRIEAENIKAVRPEEKKSPDPEALSSSSPDSSIQTEGSSLIQNEIGGEGDGGDSINLAGVNGVRTPERKESSANAIETDRECTDNSQTQEPPETKESCANKTEASKEEGTAFSRQKNTSLRSRQSRLARRINSLSTPVTSPDSAGSSAAVSEYDEHKSKPAELKLREKDGERENDRKQSEKREKSSSGSVPIDDDMSRRPNHAENKAPKVNGHVSHKVTVSTETKSKVIISKSSASGQNSQTTSSSSSKSRVPLQKAATNIPGVVKTTRNVRVQQTTQREAPVNGRTITQKAEISRKAQSKPPAQSKTSAPKCPVPAKAQSSIRQPRVSNLTNGSKNGSPASSVSSLCNVNTNVKLIKNEKTASADRTSANKITIQHNGSVKFMKNNMSATKPTSGLNSTPKIEKNVTSRRRAFI